MIEKEQRSLIVALAFEFQSRRALEDADILLYDTTAPIVERSSRSCAKVPAGEETVLNNVSTLNFLSNLK